jgi:predicted negative regulator of RcsB-dependent stress response
MSADLKDSPVPLAEISQGPNAFEVFLDRNQKGIAAFAILLAIGAVALVIYRGIETSRQETAGSALTKAADLGSFQAVVDGHADTTAAGSAMVLLADSQWTAGKQDDAIATLRKFIAASPTHPAVPTAKANLGAKLMAQGKSGDATKIFDELVADPAARFIAPFALISLGDLSKSAGDLEKAEASYNKVKTEFPESSFAETASKRIATLKAKPPVEIEPPPAPPAPPAAGGGAPPSLAPPSESVIPSLETPVETPSPAPVAPKP